MAVSPLTNRSDQVFPARTAVLDDENLMYLYILPHCSLEAAENLMLCSKKVSRAILFAVLGAQAPTLLPLRLQLIRNSRLLSVSPSPSTLTWLFRQALSLFVGESKKETVARSSALHAIMGLSFDSAKALQVEPMEEWLVSIEQNTLKGGPWLLLHAASREGFRDIVNLVIEIGNFTNDDQQCLLRQAIRCDDLLLVKELLQARCATRNDWIFAFSEALNESQIEIFNFLLDATIKEVITQPVLDRFARYFLYRICHEEEFLLPYHYQFFDKGLLALLETNTARGLSAQCCFDILTSTAIKTSSPPDEAKKALLLIVKKIAEEGDLTLLKRALDEISQHYEFLTSEDLYSIIINAREEGHIETAERLLTAMKDSQVL